MRSMGQETSTTKCMERASGGYKKMVHPTFPWVTPGFLIPFRNETAKNSSPL
jgi:hypothetical protein